MKYQEYKNARQEEFNKLPIFYAFGEKQFREALEARGIKREEAGQRLYRLGHTGGFFLREDKEVVDEFFKRDADGELRKMMEADHAFAREAFEYEMYNHEYPINLEGDFDVCSCFGNLEWEEEKGGTEYLTELGFSKDVINIYIQAANHVCKTMEY